MEAPENRRFYFEIYSSSPLAHLYRWKGGQHLPQAYGINVRYYGKHVGEHIGELGEHGENTLGTKEK